jgi:hypothetical protein
MSARRFLSPILAVVLCSLLPGLATAAPITIGQLPPSPPGYSCFADSEDLFQINVAGGPGYEVPAGYTTLVSWSTYSSIGSFEQFSLRIYDRQSASAYVVEREDGPRLLAYSTVNTFKADVPVAQGDIIGIEQVNGFNEPNACLFETGLAGDEYGIAKDAVGVHETGNYSTFDKYRVNVSAVLERPPTLTLISPASGSIAGGAKVILAGHDLSGAEEVRFGAVKAQFDLTSDDQIEATAPAAPSTGPVDVTITTAAGTTAKVAGDLFTYTPGSSGDSPGPLLPTTGVPCVVPKLKGKSLKAVRKALKKADCKLGKVGGARGKRAKVKKQGAKPGTRLPAGSKVSVRLAAG